MGCGRAGARLLPGAVPAGTAPVSTDSRTAPYTWPPFLITWWGLCGGCRSGPSVGSAVMGYAGRATAGRPCQVLRRTHLSWVHPASRYMVGCER